MTLDIYELLAWSIDFEGNISVRECYFEKFNSIYYQIEVNISNTSKELLEAFKDRVKFGKILGPDKKKERYKLKYKWRMNRKEMKLYLPLILPYFNLKYRQCELAIEALNILKTKEECNKLSIKNRRDMYTYDERFTLSLICKECKILNERGTLV